MEVIDKESVVYRMYLKALKMMDSYIEEYIATSETVTLYVFCGSTGHWEQSDVEGRFFICNRSKEPFGSITIIGDPKKANLMEPILEDWDWKSEEPLLLFKKDKNIHGILFHDFDDYGVVTGIVEGLVKALGQRRPTGAKPKYVLPGMHFNIDNPYSVVPSPFTQVPNPFPQAANPYSQAPSSHPQAPNPYSQGPSSHPQAPNPYSQGPSSHPQAPNPYSQAPNPFPQAPNPFPQAPSPYLQAQNPVPQATSPFPRVPNPFPYSQSPHPPAPSAYPNTRNPYQYALSTLSQIPRPYHVPQPLYPHGPYFMANPHYMSGIPRMPVPQQVMPVPQRPVHNPLHAMNFPKRPTHVPQSNMTTTQRDVASSINIISQVQSEFQKVAMEITSQLIHVQSKSSIKGMPTLNDNMNGNGNDNKNADVMDNLNDNINDNVNDCMVDNVNDINENAYGNVKGKEIDIVNGSNSASTPCTVKAISPVETIESDDEPKLLALSAKEDDFKDNDEKEINELVSLLQEMDTSSKPVLITPDMFAGKVVNEERRLLGNVEDPEPLNEKQMLQALIYLLKHDTEFVTKLHKAYIKSFYSKLP